MGRHTVAELTRPEAVRSKVRSNLLERLRVGETNRTFVKRHHDSGTYRVTSNLHAKEKQKDKKRQPTDSQRDGISFGHDSEVGMDVGSTGAASPHVCLSAAMLGVSRPDSEPPSPLRREPPCRSASATGRFLRDGATDPLGGLVWLVYRGL